MIIDKDEETYGLNDIWSLHIIVTWTFLHKSSLFYIQMYELN